MRVKTARSWTRCLIYWCARAAQRPGGSAIVRSLGDTLLVLLLRMLLGEQQPPGGLLRLMSDERLMPAVLAVMATRSSRGRWRVWPPARFITGHLCPSFCPRLSPDAAGVAVAVANGAGRPASAPERQTNLEVIAERCGFQSLASFSKRFKMRYGVTPGEWRRASASRFAKMILFPVAWFAVYYPTRKSL